MLDRIRSLCIETLLQLTRRNIKDSASIFESFSTLLHPTAQRNCSFTHNPQVYKIQCNIYLSTYFEHLRTTMFAIGDNSFTQFFPDEGELSISSNSSRKELLFPSNHLNDPSRTRPSSIFLVLLATAIFSASI